jgi:VanZ family protein
MSALQRWLLASSYTLALTIAFLIPVPPKTMPDIVGFDKLFHVGLFIIFAWVWHIAAKPRLPILVVAGFFYGLGIEFLQQFTGRGFEYLDLLADCVGLGVAGMGIRRWG